MSAAAAELLALVLAALAGLTGVLASAHALLNKRRPRAAFGWIAVCLTFPFAGALLYFLFGVNRIRRRARKLRGDAFHQAVPEARIAGVPPEHAELAALGQRLSGQPLMAGVAIEPLHNGEQAFPAMLEAIDAARHRVLLGSYIFDTDDTGRAFADALGRAVARGVDVRVLLDGVGELYSFPRARRMLARRGVEVLRFLPPRLFPPSVMLNLRNHRKLLLVDGDLAFAGGMNISDRHLAANGDARHRVVDVHFRLRGPVVAGLEDVFERDWAFAGGTETPPAPPMPPALAGEAAARVIADGPDEPLDRLLLLLVGAVGMARKRVLIMTPYFIPPRELLGALQAAALRGVAVTIVLPAHNNLFYVHRAARHGLWELLQRGVRVYYQPGPFVHSKLFLVDDQYAQIGSANLDSRSLRLNFELIVEVYERAFVARLYEHADAACEGAHEVTLAEVDGRPLHTRLLDGLAWLFSPYL
ncbi:MAG: phospholipase D-like domain-containing protein [Pseudomonadota bacterium]